MQRMQEIKDDGRTLFYVSHAPASVRKMCDRVLVLEKGVLGFDGPTDQGIHYLHYDDVEDDVNSEEQDDDELGADV
jgi:ABC-2 type transport system ATP-binding protein